MGTELIVARTLQSKKQELLTNTKCDTTFSPGKKHMNEVLLGAGLLEVILRGWRKGTIGTNKIGCESLIHEFKLQGLVEMTSVTKESYVSSCMVCVQVGTFRQDEKAFNATIQVEKTMNKQLTKSRFALPLL